MTKSDLIEQMAHKLDIPSREASAIVNILLKKMTETLAEGRSIEIRGFGSFTVKEYEAYEGRNPKSGEKIKVQPKKLPVFKVGKELKERVNGRK
jgi:integration host factor subunit beta